MKKKIKYALIGLLALAPLSLSAIPALAVNTYTTADVLSHNTSASCWASVSNNVYDLTSWISAHPGGSSAIIALCGTNATTAFNAIHGSNAAALSALASFKIGVIGIADTTLPSAPTNLSALAISAGQINLSWTAATDNIGVTGYNIYRDSILVASSTSPSFINVGLSPATSYTYTLRAFDAAGNLSVLSSPATATTLASSGDTSLPSAPSNLTATATSSSQINLSWTASTDNVAVTGYNIYRGGTLIGTSASNSFNDTGLSLLNSYTYTVRAFDAAGNLSLPSNTLAVIIINTNNQGNNDDNDDEDEDEDEHGNNNEDDDEDGDEREDKRGDNNDKHFGQNRELQNNGSQFNRNRERSNDEDDD